MVTQFGSRFRIILQLIFHSFIIHLLLVLVVGVNVTPERNITFKNVASVYLCES